MIELKHVGFKIQRMIVEGSLTVFLSGTAQCIPTGSRINKQWFLVRDSQQEVDAVLTMVPWSPQCVISFTKGTKKTLKELFSLLQVCAVKSKMFLNVIFSTEW